MHSREVASACEVADEGAGGVGKGGGDDHRVGQDGGHGGRCQAATNQQPTHGARQQEQRLGRRRLLLPQAGGVVGGHDGPRQPGGSECRPQRQMHLVEGGEAGGGVHGEHGDAGEPSDGHHQSGGGKQRDGHPRTHQQPHLAEVLGLDGGHGEGEHHERGDVEEREPALHEAEGGPHGAHHRVRRALLASGAQRAQAREDAEHADERRGEGHLQVRHQLLQRLVRRQEPHHACSHLKEGLHYSGGVHAFPRRARGHAPASGLKALRDTAGRCRGGQPGGRAYGSDLREQRRFGRGGHHMAPGDGRLLANSRSHVGRGTSGWHLWQRLGQRHKLAARSADRMAHRLRPHVLYDVLPTLSP
mmetsp:Transcript_9307/g.19190  ORF Transcript_9307/g.19190 Transcript_9307/m.19190 type:complete len:359 (-) Transcript_9307:49-1125(-)